MKSTTMSLALVTVALAACGGDDAATPIDAATDAAAPDAADVDAPPPVDAGPDARALPAFRNPVTLADLPLAQAAAGRLGVGTSKACDQCHALTRDTLTRWLTETRAGDACLTTFAPTA